MTTKQEKLSKINELMAKQGYSFDFRCKVYFAALEYSGIFDLVEMWEEELEEASKTMDTIRELLKEVEAK